MNFLHKILEAEGVLLLDGAMGTMLMDAGLEQGAPPEEWNVSHPDKVRAVHRGYIEAGSNIILTNSFGGTRFRLKLHDLEDRVPELNRAAAVNAKAEANAAGRRIIVGGSMGPTGELMAPIGNMAYEDARLAFAEQAAALEEGGADILWIETMSDLEEVRAAVEGAKSVSDLPIAATMTFDTHGRTMMGVTPAKALAELNAFGLAAIGANCGNGPAEIEEVIQTMRSLNRDVILIAKSNAGIPKWINEELIYDGTPEVMGQYSKRVYRLGAQMIGGCCGSSPAHIKAMADALKGDGPILAEVVSTTNTSRVDKPARERRHRRHRRE